MTTRDIRTSTVYAVCDVCGRTLLRGERAEIYLHGGERHSVCELCKSRALHEGWVREGTVPSYGDGDARSERRRSLLARFRAARRDAASVESAEAYDEPAQATAPAPVPATPPAFRREAGSRRRERVREPRHVRAVPTSAEQKTASAVELFNESEHTRTVAGVARSLGLPRVSVLPLDSRPGLVNIVVSWELCWYRYEVDLSDEVPSVRVERQGYELDELPPEERQSNALSDEHGRLSLA